MITGNESIQPVVVPGFTYSDGSSEERYIKSEGLTIRQHFAAMAMWSYANPHNSNEHTDRANWAILEADALIAELNKK